MKDGNLLLKIIQELSKVGRNLTCCLCCVLLGMRQYIAEEGIWEIAVSRVVGSGVYMDGLLGGDDFTSLVRDKTLSSGETSQGGLKVDGKVLASKQGVEMCFCL